MKFSGLKMCECKKMTNIRYAFRNMTAKFFFQNALETVFLTKTPAYA